MSVRDAMHRALVARYTAAECIPDDEYELVRWPCPDCQGGEGNGHRPLCVHADGRVACETCGSDAAAIFDVLGTPEAERGVVVAQIERNGTTTTPRTDRRERAASLIRRVDLVAELRKPPRPVQYRIDRFVMDGALTVLCGRAGQGKSFVAIDACRAVTTGTDLAGMTANKGKAVYVDGEMGTAMMADRLRDAGLPGDAFTYLDVNGLNLADEAHVAELSDQLGALGVNFAVIDSMRRLAPGTRENESDDIAPLLARLATMARDLDIAILLLHHAGYDDSRFVRGSSAIPDQSDMLFGLIPAGDDVKILTADPGRGGKFRPGRVPEDRHLRLVVGGGVVVVPAAPSETTTTPQGPPPVHLEYEADMLRRLLDAEGPLRVDDIKAAAGKAPGNQSVNGAWRAIRERHLARETENGWVANPEPARARLAELEPDGAQAGGPGRAAPACSCTPPLPNGDGGCAKCGRGVVA